MKLRPEDRKTLRNVLSQYLPSKDRAALVCSDAGLDLSRIDLGGSAEILWQNLLLEAERSGPGMLARLLDECLAQAPALEATVREIRDQYLSSSGGRVPSSARTAPAPQAGTASTSPAGTPSAPRGGAAAITVTSTHPQGAGRPVSIFVSYSHKDESLREELLTHLSILRRQDLATIWHDRKITPGDEWKGQIDHELETADVILLLVSPSFLASDYCYDIEMSRAMDRHGRGEARVIPIIVRPCDWTHAPFAKLQALPRDAKPVTTWGDRDEAWLDVARGLRAVIGKV